MKTPFLICALCLALVAGISGCGGDDATSSETQDSGSETVADSGGGAKPDEGPLKATPSKVVLGDYESEGPFSAIAGQEGNKKPRFTPSGEPAPKKVVTRELEVGSGSAVERGDEVSVYYAGADHATGKIRYYGWPPNRPATFQRLGFGTFGKSWEKTIEGMKAGGVRQVIITASYLSPKPLDYVIVLTDMRPQSEEP